MIQWASRFPVLESPRVILREFEDSDFSRFGEIFSDPRVCAHFGFEPKAEDLQRWFDSFRDRFSKNQGIRWAIIHKESQILIGNVGFHRVQPELALAECGLQISPEFWLQGYGSEAAQIAGRWLVKNTPIRNIEAWIGKNNQATLGLVKKYGFQLTGEEKIENGFNLVRALLTAGAGSGV